MSKTSTYIAIIISNMLLAFTFDMLWQWIIVPIFNVVDLSYIQSIAVVHFIQFCKMRYTENGTNEENFDNAIEAISYAISGLIIGFIISLAI